VFEVSALHIDCPTVGVQEHVVEFDLCASWAIAIPPGIAWLLALGVRDTCNIHTQVLAANPRLEDATAVALVAKDVFLLCYVCEEGALAELFHVGRWVH